MWLVKRRSQEGTTQIGVRRQIAFGEAGWGIIGKSLGEDGDLNPMMAGSKMHAVFGFAIVRNFADCTECLQEDVMVFVNTIASIVHRAVKATSSQSDTHACIPCFEHGEAERWNLEVVTRPMGLLRDLHMQDTGGAPNKNIGEAFLTVWRFPRGAAPAVPTAGDCPPGGTIADNALQAFVRACVEVQVRRARLSAAAFSCTLKDTPAQPRGACYVPKHVMTRRAGS